MTRLPQFIMAAVFALFMASQSQGAEVSADANASANNPVITSQPAENGLHSKSMDEKLQQKTTEGMNKEAAEGDQKGAMQNKVQSNEQKLEQEMIHGNAPESRPSEEVKVGTTKENLQAGFEGESKAAAKYAAYAKKAEEEDYPQVAALFRAASAAESIHANNHARVLKEMGVEAKKPEMQEPQVRSTKENLEDALNGETYEFEKMYPAFIKEAKQKNERNAVRTFDYAWDVEKQHGKLYKKVLGELDSLKGKKAEAWYICPVCGYTVSKAEMTFKRCPVCQTPVEKFKEVTKDNMAEFSQSNS